MTSITHLPPELQLSILTYLPFPTLKELSLTSHHFRALTLSSIFTSLHIPFNHPLHLLSEFLKSFKTKGYRCNGIGSLFHEIRGQVRYITVSTPTVGTNNILNNNLNLVDLVFEYYREIGLSWGVFSNLKEVKVVYSSSEGALDRCLGFDGVILGALFNPVGIAGDVEGEGEEEGLLSHYKTLKTLRLDITMMEPPDDEEEEEEEERERVKEGEKQGILTPTIKNYITNHPFNLPTTLPALHNLTLSLNITHIYIPPPKSRLHPLWSTSQSPTTNILPFILQNSQKSLTTLSIWLTTDLDPLSSSSEITFPPTILFPNVKRLRFHSWWMWVVNYSVRKAHISELARVAPNIETLEMYVERETVVPPITIHEIHAAFSLLGELWGTNNNKNNNMYVSKLKRVRVYWPVRPVSPNPEIRRASIEELGMWMAKWKYECGLNGLETVVFVRKPLRAKGVVDWFEAVAGTFVAGGGGTVEWSKVYREKLLDLEEPSWLQPG